MLSPPCLWAFTVASLEPKGERDKRVTAQTHHSLLLVGALTNFWVIAGYGLYQ